MKITLLTITFLILCITSYGETHDPSKKHKEHIILKTTNGKKYLSSNNGFSWRCLENKTKVIILNKSDGSKFMSDNKGYSWLKLNIYKFHHDIEFKINKTIVSNKIILINNKFSSGIVKIKCFDLLGNMMFEQLLQSNGYNKQFLIDVSLLRNGSYFLVMNNNFSSNVLYFIKK